VQRFEQVAALIQARIASNNLKSGEKLPSLRRLAGETGFSVQTVYKGYELLESLGICSARDRSGFYVKASQPAQTPRRHVERPPPPPVEIRSIEAVIVSRMRSGNLSSAFQLDSDLVPYETLGKLLRSALLKRHSGIGHQWSGHQELRTAIARRASQRGIFVDPNEVVIARSETEAFNLCVDSLADQERPILVESPSYYPAVESLRHRGVRAIEIYSHPKFGVDPDLFEQILAKTGVKICVLMGTNHIPTGRTYKRESLLQIVVAARRYGATIIENNIQGELSYGVVSAPTLKEFDRGDTVLQIGGTSALLSQSYEVGWVIAGNHTSKLIANQHLGGAHTPHYALQEALGRYLGSRVADRNMRTVCQRLSDRMNVGLQLISAHFPKSCAVSKPEGGYLCWVRGPRELDAIKQAMSSNDDTFDFIPGPFFSIAGSFTNFIALNFSRDWTPDRRRRLARLGEVLHF
jgi:DNA-binding transcriptional MocR family regulator